MSSGLSSGAGRAAASCRVYLLDCRALCEVLEACDGETPRLSMDECVRFDRIRVTRGEGDARLWRASHIALRIALEQASGPIIRGKVFESGPGGRPFVSGGPHFSLAHSNDVALIGIAPTGALGVDIEVAREVQVDAARRERIEEAARSLAPEVALPRTAEARFLQAWVRLEAFAKATGVGIGRVLTRSGAVGGGLVETGLAPAGGCMVRDLDAGAGRFAAVAAKALPSEPAVTAFPKSRAAIAAFLKSHADRRPG